MTLDVFISYSRRDLEFVTNLHQALTERGIEAWFDKENIQVADHWRTSIAEGIRNCQVFVLVQSPDSFASPNVRKEVDLAERHNKRIVPLNWRLAEIPVAFEYQLAGLQYIDFSEVTSEEKFDELADVIKRLLGGSSLSDATSGKKSVAAAAVPALDEAAEEEASATPPSGGGRRLGGGRKLGGGRRLGRKSTLSPIAIGGRVISSVVTRSFDLEVEDQDWVSGELNWMFRAADNLLKIRDGAVPPETPVSVDFPEDAQHKEGADNRIDNSDGLAQEIAKNQSIEIESLLKSISQYHLKEITTLLEQESERGEEGRHDTSLQRRIRGERRQIIEKLGAIANVIEGAYGILITTPQQLLEMLEA